jgi:hypothetical protein
MVTAPGENGKTQESRFVRWQEKTQTQLGFLNDVLLALGAALIGFGLTQSDSADLYCESALKVWIFGIALLANAVSVAVGLGAATTRLRSMRMTMGRIRVEELEESITAKKNIDEIEVIENLKRKYNQWSEWTRLSWSENSKTLKKSAQARKDFLTNYVPASPEAEASNDGLAGIDDVKKAAKNWEQGLDNWTWRLLWTQLILFGVGSTLFALISIIARIRP